MSVYRTIGPPVYGRQNTKTGLYGNTGILCVRLCDVFDYGKCDIYGDLCPFKKCRSFFSLMYVLLSMNCSLLILFANDIFHCSFYA